MPPPLLGGRSQPEMLLIVKGALDHLKVCAQLLAGEGHGQSQPLAVSPALQQGVVGSVSPVRKVAACIQHGLSGSGKLPVAGERADRLEHFLTRQLQQVFAADEFNRYPDGR